MYVSVIFYVETMDELNRLKKDYEKRLKFMSSKDPDAIELLNKIVNVECNLARKYPSFDFVQLLSNNGQSAKGLRQLSSGLDVLCKYGMNLLTPAALRQNGWQKIIYGNQVFMKDVDCIQGARDLLQRLGYVFRDYFAEFEESGEAESIVVLVVDMIAVKHEIDAYLAKEHPHPDLIRQHSTKHSQRLSCATSQGKVSQAENSLRLCSICGDASTLICRKCDDKVFCNGCSERQHMHPSRRAHQVSSIIHASKNCKAAPERDRPPKVNTSSETNTPSSAPSPGILRSMLSYAFSYILPKQTNLLQEPPLLEVRSELAEVTNKQTEEEEKEEDFIDAPSLNIRADSASKTPEAESSLYVLDREEYHSRMVDAYDEIEREKKEAKARFEANLLSTSSPVNTTEYISEHGAHNRKLITNTGRKGNIQEIERCRQMTEDGLAVVKALREAEEIGYLEEEFQCILLLNESSQPSVYMKTEWAEKVRMVHQLLTAEDLTCGHWVDNDHVRLALAECYGNVQDATRVCANKWRQQIDDLWSLCYLDDEFNAPYQVVKVLDDFSGDFEAARNHLIKKLFKDRIWRTVQGKKKAEEEIYRRMVPCLDEELAKAVQDASVDRERRIRMILVEADLPGWKRAENVLELLERSSELEGDICLQDIVEGIRTYGNIQDCCNRYLQIDCVLCFEKFPQSKIHTLGCCECKICRECVKRHFEIVIREKYVRDMVCPKCQLPEIDRVGADLHFQFLSILLRPLLSADDFDLLQTKWRDWNLMQEESFVWCTSDECKFGFLADGNNKEVQCPSCKRSMCKDCKKQWEDQHLNLSCEVFNEWKIANDPEQQLTGLARHLEENGIECPQCKSRYSLAKGGCMHFTCGQCRHEFCSGCRQPFRRAGGCKQFKRCAALGIHSHHPRDCLYYLKEYSTEKLQQLLRESSVPYDSDIDAAQVSACSVMIQKVTETGAKDEPCGNEAPPGYAGLCELHYKEYLVSLINRNGIDPIPIMETNNLIHLLDRTDRQAPERQREEKEDAYRLRVIELILAQIPLERQPLGNQRPVNVGVEEN